MEYTPAGLARLEEILGPRGKKIVDSLHAISPDFAKMIVNFGYGELYTRNALSDKEKELAAVASLVSQGKTGLPLKAHFQGMQDGLIHSLAEKFLKIFGNSDDCSSTFNRVRLTESEIELLIKRSKISRVTMNQTILNVGWTKNEIIELLIFLTGFVGLPTTVEAFVTLQEIL